MSNLGSASNGSNGNTHDGSTLTPAPQPNAAKGNKQGQTTLAARIGRWEVLVNNLAQRPTETPKSLHDAFVAVLAQAKATRDQRNLLRTDEAKALELQKELVVQGDELYSRLRLNLRSNFGRASSELHSYGVQPARKPPGRRKKAAVVAATTPHPAPAAATAAGETKK